MEKRAQARTALTWTAITIVATGCGGEEIASAGPEVQEAPPTADGETAGLVRREIPAEDPGPPFYARLGVQFYVDDGILAIPFYRPPECIPADFNLLDFYHFPGPDGPGAFACPLLSEGFLLTEPDAALGVFPRRVELRGEEIPFWFVDSGDFDEIAADGTVTMSDLEALSPLQGSASRYAETLHPRDGSHKVIIRAQGEAEGRRFRFVVTDIQFDVRQVSIQWGR